jgi:hypothetical protein
LRRRKLAIKPIDRLIEDMHYLEELQFCSSKELEEKINWQAESRPPTSINVLNFKIKMEKEIRRICRKIENKVGFDMPDGLK